MVARSGRNAVRRRPGGGRFPAVLALVVALVVAGGASCSGGSDGGGAPEGAGSGSRPAGGTSPSAPAPGPGPGPGKAVAYRGFRSAQYADPGNWLCRPDRDDPCDHDLDVTSVAADGTLEVVPVRPDPDAPIDCFYVYPTISRDPGANSDLEPGEDEEYMAVRAQAAFLGPECRVFAPVYRQVTLTALSSRLGGGAGTTTTAPAAGRDRSSDPGEIAYGDVLAAWKHYVANDNGGRGVVLIGHSQGAGILTRLVAREIDGRPALRSRLVSAYLLGAAVAVPEGRDVGGAFRNIPLCRTRDRTGCVVSFASFRDTAPPPANSFFGRPREGGGVAACVNPAAPSGGRVVLHPRFPTAGQSILGGTTKPTPWIDPSLGRRITTAWVTTPGLVEGGCVSRGGFDYLSVHVNADPSDPRIDDIGGDLTPEWGLHLLDVNLVAGDISTMVRAQSAAYHAAR